MVLPRLVKKVIGKMLLLQGGGREIHTLEIGGHVQMAKSDAEAQTKVLVIGLDMVGKMSMGLDLESY
jgi:hypothetical protein